MYVYFNVNFNVFFKLIKVHLLVIELYIIDVCLIMKLYSFLTPILLPLQSVGCFMFLKQLLVHLS